VISGIKWFKYNSSLAWYQYVRMTLCQIQWLSHTFLLSCPGILLTFPWTKLLSIRMCSGTLLWNAKQDVKLRWSLRRGELKVHNLDGVSLSGGLSVIMVLPYLSPRLDWLKLLKYVFGVIISLLLCFFPQPHRPCRLSLSMFLFTNFSRFMLTITLLLPCTKTGEVFRWHNDILTSYTLCPLDSCHWAWRDRAVLTSPRNFPCWQPFISMLTSETPSLEGAVQLQQEAGMSCWQLRQLGVLKHVYNVYPLHVNIGSSSLCATNGYILLHLKLPCVWKLLQCGSSLWNDFLWGKSASWSLPWGFRTFK